MDITKAAAALGRHLWCVLFHKKTRKCIAWDSPDDVVTCEKCGHSWIERNY